jgi:hypothetical protein
VNHPTVNLWKTFFDSLKITKNKFGKSAAEAFIKTKQCQCFFFFGIQRDHFAPRRNRFSKIAASISSSDTGRERLWERSMPKRVLAEGRKTLRITLPSSTGVKASLSESPTPRKSLISLGTVICP